jgi:small subunit ribosomal protein S24e
MEIEIISDRTNALFDRREINFSVITDTATPSKADLKKSLCSKLNLPPDSTAIVEIGQLFGSKKCVCFAHSYKQKSEMERREPKHLFKRLDKTGKAKEEKKEEAAPVAAEAKEKEKPAKETAN